MAAPSTRQMLLSLIDDVEIVSKELVDLIATPNSQKSDDIDTGQLLELLVQKDKELQEALKTAKEQEDLQTKYDALKAEVDKRDQDIKQLQQNLKEAESILGTAIYQAKRKLNSINQASQKKISSEELIKYAHKISASNAVVAPPTWAPGDPRRPYPTDMDMRCGILSRLNDISSTHPNVGSAQTLSEALGHSRPQSQLEQALNAPVPGQISGSMSVGLAGGPTNPGVPPSTYQWQSSIDSSHSSSAGATPLSQSTTHSPRGGGGGSLHAGGALMDTSNKQAHININKDDDVELMSSDSSSSSSSDE